ncbi:unnamed protein product [Gongylonema pulchrum]|uniref:Secreted protein n=1 Tax=Gongylonema pulchrum TaxID=637853 RepID=A0A183ECJ1_9BILA|nr:unnamed protein product [Gongylonema pulchrum]
MRIMSNLLMMLICTGNSRKELLDEEDTVLYRPLYVRMAEQQRVSTTERVTAPSFQQEVGRFDKAEPFVEQQQADENDMLLEHHRGAHQQQYPSVHLPASYITNLSISRCASEYSQISGDDV